MTTAIVAATAADSCGRSSTHSVAEGVDPLALVRVDELVPAIPRCRMNALALPTVHNKPSLDFGPLRPLVPALPRSRTAAEK